MRGGTTFTHRLRLAGPLLAGWFAVGLVLAGFGPQPRYLLTVTVGTGLGALLLGPCTAAALRWLARHWAQGVVLRWPGCLTMAAATVVLLHGWLGWDGAQLAVAAAAVVAGTILGHDATLAALRLRGSPDLDLTMLVVLPLLLGLAAFSGYTSLGFGIGMLQFLQALTGAS